MTQEVLHKKKCLIGLWTDDCGYNIRALFIFIAIQLLMAYSPFGFIIMSTISMTTLFIGVLIAALWGGPITGSIVGIVFGLASMWEASVTAVNGNDLIFSPFYSENPMGSVIIALVPRILFGMTAGFLYLFALEIKNKKIRIPVIVVFTVLLDRLQSMFTYLFIDIVFHIEGAYAGKAFLNMFSSKRIFQYMITVSVVLFFYYLYDRVLSKKYYQEYKLITKQKLSLTKLKYHFIVFVMVTVICVTLVHLWDRQEIILYEINNLLPEQVSGDRMLQVLFQFIVSTFSAIYIIFVFYRHARNVEEMERTQMLRQLDREKLKAEEYAERSIHDGLTGVYNRKGLEQVVEREHLETKSVAYLLIDIDYFKEVNDTYGHDKGDEVLRVVASSLEKIFQSNFVFRLGGDEFAVIVNEDITTQWQQFCDKVKDLIESVNHQMKDSILVTMSIGGIYCKDGYNKDAYRLADNALYEVKRKGKAGCCLVDNQGNVMAYWKDNDYTLLNHNLETLEHGGVCKFEFDLNNEFAHRLYCNAMIKDLIDLKKDMTPEECFQIWFSGLSKEKQTELEQCRNQCMIDKTFAFDYCWNHPTKGMIQIKSAGTSEVIDGVQSVWTYYLFV